MKNILITSAMLTFFAISTALLSGCYEGFTKANRPVENQSTVTVGMEGGQTMAFNRQDMDGPWSIANYNAAYEYDFSQNFGVSLFFDGMPGRQRYHIGALLVIDLMPKEWFLHLIWTPGVMLIIYRNNVDPWFAGSVSINMGNEFIQVYGSAGLDIMMPKLETGVYWYPFKNWFVRANIGIRALSSYVDSSGSSIDYGERYAGGSVGFTW